MAATTPTTLSSLLSLSNVAAIVPPLKLSVPAPTPAPKKDITSTGGKQGALKHRRLSSTGQARRRFSDARDAASRPNATNLHSAASALAALSISPNTTSPPAHAPPHVDSIHIHSGPATATDPVAIKHARGQTSTRHVLAKSYPTGAFAESEANLDIDVDVEEEEEDGEERHGIKGKAARGTKGKKRGTIFQCESCSKVYRHPSCLVKHRWEHSPHWREASKFLLSKHQQVQLLEAAAILSHLSPGSSLPEDRSLWPFYLSGGALPPPSAANLTPTLRSAQESTKFIPAYTSSSPGATPAPISSSVPAPSSMPVPPRATRARSGSVSTTASGPASALGATRGTTPGPRMHHYKLPGGGSSGITQFRPGVLGAPTPAGTVLAPYVDDGRSVLASVPPKPVAVPISQGLANGHGHGAGSASANGFGNAYRGSPAPSAAPSVGSEYPLHGLDEGDEGSDVEGELDYVPEHVPTYSRSLSSHPDSHSHSHSLGAGGWSLPNSDLRSHSGSGSASRSGSRSDEDESDVEIDVDDARPGYGFSLRSRDAEDDDEYGFGQEEYGGKGRRDEWEGMEMDMDL